MKKTDELMIKYKGICQICGKKIDKNGLKNFPEADHIKPKKLGGTSKRDNLALLCGDCNRKKSSLYGPEILYEILCKMNDCMGEFEMGLIDYQYRHGAIDDEDIAWAIKQLEIIESRIKKYFMTVIYKNTL